MPQPRRIYLLDPKKLPPETIAVTFAKTSRSPLPFDAIAEELSDERSADFHEKWVVGYGHSSVAEHAILHIAAENVSRLAIECIESNRLASYTEKSSRYQVWDADHFYCPEEFQEEPLCSLFTHTCTDLFDAYQQAYAVISQGLTQSLERKDGESTRGFETRVRATSADVCRYFLPASALANVGISINARALEHAIVKMLSHPLREVQTIGEEIKRKALEHVPTLVKYADPNPYLMSLTENIVQDSENEMSSNHTGSDWCNCLWFDEDGDEKVLTALVYKFGGVSMPQAIKLINALKDHEKNELINKLTGSMNAHDQPVREFEYAAAAFHLILDQGAYFELKRHRMMTQSVQAFTPHYGFAIPRLIADNGLSDLYVNMMRKASAAYETLAKENPQAAAYVLPNAFNRSVLLSMNLRSAIHLIKLRCAGNAHFAIRRPTLRIAEILQQRFPLFKELLAPCTDESWQSVEKDFFSDTHAQ